MKNLYLFLFLLVFHLAAHAQERALPGYVRDAKSKQPVPGVNIIALHTNKQTSTDKDGYFSIRANVGDSLLISAIGYEKKTVFIPESTKIMTVELLFSQSQLQEVQVVSTGYQMIPRDRSTGSFDLISNELLDRSVSTDILSRLENLSPGLLFNHGDAGNTDPFLIRGRSTITANAQPLIIVDNFPYDGTLDNINPNDIESVSILKDAAAASIWGARAGNGVIVITTKRGKTSSPKITLNSNVTFQERPDLSTIKQISSADRIELEKFLFAKGQYKSALNGTLTANTYPIPQAVELMIANPADLEQQLEKLKGYDIRNDLKDHFYRVSANQQHSLQVSGAQDKLNYYFSGGFDRNLSNLVGQDDNRITLRSANTFRVSSRLKLDAVMQYIQSNTKSGNNQGTDIMGQPNGTITPLSPYTRLVDAYGNGLPVNAWHRQGYLDTAGRGKLLDWSYNPYDEINREEHSSRERDYLVNGGVSYKIINGLETEVKYQYENQTTAESDLYKESSYYARNTVNRFTQINSSTGIVKYNIPIGGILQAANAEVVSHQARFQLNYRHSWNDKHDLTALAGYEIRSKKTTRQQYSPFYGYKEEYSSSNPLIDYVTQFPQYDRSSYSTIFNGSPGVSRLTDNFLSYFANAAYSYQKRYTLSASLRKDEANLFGVKSNQKGTPLWSVGGAWLLSNEPFYSLSALPLLKLRATYGVNGNISRLASANTTVSYSSGGQTHSLPTARIVTPPNENLRWERVGMFNAGLDFSMKNNAISGSLEYYHKNALDLLSQAPTDPTLGMSAIYANVAGMKGDGLDIQINSMNLNGGLKWQSSLIYSYSRTKVSAYLMPVGGNGTTYLGETYITPVIGKPLYGVYSYRWGGLDPQTGDPQSYYQGQLSKDYAGIINGTPLDSLAYQGPLQPVRYGALRNTISYKNISFSFNISYKLGAWFREESVNYNGLFSGWSGNSDYALRWQQPGDETHTHVPSLIYPASSNREYIYQYSEVLVQKADHIRFEDLNVVYTMSQVNRNKWPFSSARLYLYASNLGVLWKANTAGVDPYYKNSASQGRKVALGFSLTF